MAFGPVEGAAVGSPVGATEQPGGGIPGVGLDDAAAGRLAAEHLMERGLRRFGFVRDVASPRALERERGFVEVLAEHDLTCEVLALETTGAMRQRAGGERRMEQWLQSLPRPIGVLGHKPIVGFQLSQVARGLGIRMPEEMAVMVVHDTPPVCELATPLLTAVQTDFGRIGWQAAELLDAIMEGRTPEAYHLRAPPLGVIERLSTNVAAAADREVAAAMRFIEANAHRTIDVNDITAAITTVSRRQLERRFLKQLGLTPADQLRRVRLNRARALLVRTNLSIGQIAGRCGMASGTRLAELLRRQLGITPTAYRRQFQRMGLAIDPAKKQRDR